MLIVLLLSVLLVHVHSQNPLGFPCYNQSWVYDENSGKCITFNYVRMNWMNASSNCNGVLTGLSSASVGLNNPRSLVNVYEHILLMNKYSNREKIWVDIKFNGSQYIDGDSNPVNMSYSQTIINPSNATGCLSLNYQYQSQIETNWTSNYFFKVENCSEPIMFYCQHNAKRCSNPPGNFNPNTNRLTKSIVYPFQLVQSQCLSGYYPRESTQEQPSTDNFVNLTLSRDQYYCLASRSSSADQDPMTITTFFQYSGFNITECTGVQCNFNSLDVPYLETKFSPSQNRFYNYGDVIPMSCMIGFVAYNDSTTRRTSLVCEQGQPNSPIGVFFPMNLQPCVMVECDAEKMLKMLPRKASFTEARSQITGQTFSSFQINQFNMNGNVVKISCNDATFFLDRTRHKTIQCNFIENSTTIADWSGYDTTVMPLPDSCYPITCLASDIPTRKKLNQKIEFVYKTFDGIVSNETLHPKLEYNYMDSLTFKCLDGFETIESAQHITTTCSLSGKWVPFPAGCLIIELPINVTNGVKFESQAKEAHMGSAVGGFTLAIVGIFVAIIIFLDLTSALRDIRLFINNLKLQKRRIARFFNEKKKAK